MQSQPLKILVVEDDPLVREVVCAQLFELSHEPIPTEGGREALEKFQAESFDLVITDRSMPGMNGDELASAIKRINPAMPVILLTGFGDMLDEGVQIEVDLIVCKPFTFKMLRESLEKVMNR